MDVILVPTAPGELIDKLTILRLKAEKITDTAKLANVRHEQNVLSQIAERTLPDSDALKQLWEQLYKINGELWVIEDDIRACEARNDFDILRDLSRRRYRHRSLPRLVAR